VQLRDHFVSVEKAELEVGMLLVQPQPVPATGLIVVHEDREGPAQALASITEIRPVGVADQPHRESKATA
jgi:hypothetical protein